MINWFPISVVTKEHLLLIQAVYDPPKDINDDRRGVIAWGIGGRFNNEWYIKEAMSGELKIDSSDDNFCLHEMNEDYFRVTHWAKVPLGR